MTLWYGNTFRITIPLFGGVAESQWYSSNSFLAVFNLDVTERCAHDDVIKWKHFPRYWPFVWGIHRSPVNFSHKSQWRGTMMFFYLRLNKRLSKESWDWWFETPSRPLWCHCFPIHLINKMCVSSGNQSCLLMMKPNINRWFHMILSSRRFLITVSPLSSGRMNTYFKMEMKWQNYEIFEYGEFWAIRGPVLLPVILNIILSRSNKGMNTSTLNLPESWTFLFSLLEYMLQNAI